MSDRKIEVGKVETQFMFFYDLRATITNIETGDDGPADNKYFDWRKVDDSYLNINYFADKFVSKIVSAHFHGTNSLLKKLQAPEGFAFSEEPIAGGNPEKDYCFLECTLFKNGSLVIVVRIVNNTELSYQEYVDMIACPEFAGQRKMGNTGSGKLIEWAWSIASTIEERLLSYINGLSLTVASMNVEENKECKLEMIPASREEKNKKDVVILRKLLRSRPYIGSIVDVVDKDIKASDTDVQRLAIACARTTPAFVDGFIEPNTYINEDTPRRNLYHPGSDIVLIGRRGWSCIVLDKNKNRLSFQMGVIETTLFAIEAIYSSMRTTRRFVCDMVNQGKEYSNPMLNALINYKRNYFSKNDPFPHMSPDIIHKYTSFIARADLNAPLDDMSTLLKSHFITHTGIAAIERLEELSEHEKLLDNAKHTLAHYNGFLHVADQYWMSQRIRAAQRAIIISIIGIFVTVALSLEVFTN